jgi:hypothetical protein
LGSEAKKLGFSGGNLTIPSKEYNAGKLQDRFLRRFIMPAEQKTKVAQADVCENNPYIVEPERFVPVAIPEKFDHSQSLKTDLEAYDIPVQLEVREAEMDDRTLGGIPVLVPEGTLDNASELVGIMDLNALDANEEEFDEFDDLEDEDEDEDLDFDDEEYDEEEDEEDEEDEEEEDLDFDDDADDDEEEFEDLDDKE